jgi:multicomponent K+:H+ antiporter subunit C
MELVIAVSIGVLFGSAVWLLLRPRSFQVLMGLILMSFAVNLFIFAAGRLRVDRPPVILEGGPPDPTLYSDPLVQALVLTAIVIGFATTALYLVLLLGSRGINDTDHVDGKEPE